MSLNKHIDGLSNLLSLLKLNFPIIDFSEHRIRLNTPFNNISLPGYAFCFDEKKSTHSGTGFFINEKYLCTKQRDFNILLHKNLELTFIEIKGIFSVASVNNFNLDRLTPLLEKLNKIVISEG